MWHVCLPFIVSNLAVSNYARTGCPGPDARKQHPGLTSSPHSSHPYLDPQTRQGTYGDHAGQDLGLAWWAQAVHTHISDFTAFGSKTSSRTKCLRTKFLHPFFSAKLSAKDLSSASVPKEWQKSVQVVAQTPKTHQNGTKWHKMA